jgi:hypothetical protein
LGGAAPPLHAVAAAAVPFSGAVHNSIEPISSSERIRSAAVWSWAIGPLDRVWALQPWVSTFYPLADLIDMSRWVKKNSGAHM